MKNDRQYDFDRNLEDTGKLMTASRSGNRWKIVILIIVAVAVVAVAAVFGIRMIGGANNGAEKTYENSKPELSDSKYVGIWKAVSMAVGDSGIYNPITDAYFDFTLTLNEDGTGNLSSDGEERESFIWALSDDGFNTKGDKLIYFKDDGDRIKGKIVGFSIIFEKQ